MQEGDSDGTVTVQPIKFASFEDLGQAQGELNKNLEILMDIKLQLTVELGRTELPIKKVLELAVKLGGESFSDYRKPDGSKGDFDTERKVYKRENQKCHRCGTKIKRIKVAQRSAFFCPQCQKL